MIFLYFYNTEVPLLVELTVSLLLLLLLSWLSLLFLLLFCLKQVNPLDLPASTEDKGGKALGFLLSLVFVLVFAKLKL